MADTNTHVIRFYRDLQAGRVNGAVVREYLTEQGQRLLQRGEEVYYAIRAGFNQQPDSLAFLFLNRACFNGVMRFNRKGEFNVPFCRKPARFAKALVTKIVNQVVACGEILTSLDWEFRVADFRDSLAEAKEGDFVYADPPYAGRYVDYFQTWTETDERELTATLKSLSVPFLLSTWTRNRHRVNLRLSADWPKSEYSIGTVEHYYHVGPTEENRGTMIEALVRRRKPRRRVLA